MGGLFSVFKSFEVSTSRALRHLYPAALVIALTTPAHAGRPVSQEPPGCRPWSRSCGLCHDCREAREEARILRPHIPSSLIFSWGLAFRVKSSFTPPNS